MEIGRRGRSRLGNQTRSAKNLKNKGKSAKKMSKEETNRRGGFFYLLKVEKTKQDVRTIDSQEIWGQEDAIDPGKAEELRTQMMDIRNLIMNNYETDGTLPVKSKSMNKSVNDDRDNRHAGWKAINWIPNVRKFSVRVSGMDKLFAFFGIEKRMKPELRFEPGKNKPLNRYIEHQFRRMDYFAKDKPLVTWRIGMHMVRRSNIFYTMALNHVYPKWHRQMKLSSVIALAVQVRRIANSDDSKLDYRRVYLPKPGGK